MGCKPCKQNEGSEIEKDDNFSTDSKNQNSQNTDGNKPPFTQINISSIYIYDKKGIKDKGKLKENDLKEFKQNTP